MLSPSCLSIVIPVLNEQTLIAEQIEHVRTVAPGAELLVVDGGSTDRTAEMAQGLADHFLEVSPGRAQQMNAGAGIASGRYLLFLHADTRLPDDLVSVFQSWSETQPLWGYFPLRLSGSEVVFRLIERMINLRTLVTAGATGDQCQVIRKDVFQALGGFPEIPLMEDLALSRRMRRIAVPRLFPSKVLTSSRRWQDNGIVRTVLLMWALRSLYTLGLPPRYFAKAYRQQGDSVRQRA